MSKANLSVVCIGAGPAGLTAGYLLSKEGVRVTVLEADPTYVGGIFKTPTYKGFAFDIGGHRFFSGPYMRVKGSRDGAANLSQLQPQ